MAEEKKLNALCDEALEGIAGGLDDGARILLNEIVAMAKGKGFTLEDTIEILGKYAKPEDEQTLAESREYVRSIW